MVAKGVCELTGRRARMHQCRGNTDVKEATVAEPFTRDYRQFRPEHLPEIREIPGRQAVTPSSCRRQTLPLDTTAPSPRLRHQSSPPCGGRPRGGALGNSASLQADHFPAFFSSSIFFSQSSISSRSTAAFSNSRFSAAASIAPRISLIRLSSCSRLPLRYLFL